MGGFFITIICVYDTSEEQITEISNNTEGYSGSDMANLCKAAVMGPIR